MIESVLYMSFKEAVLSAPGSGSGRAVYMWVMRVLQGRTTPEQMP